MLLRRYIFGRFMSIKYHIHFPYGTELPKKLYKYVSFQENHIRSLLTDELYFNSPDSFNDPYEPFLLFEGNERYGATIKSGLEKSAITCFSRSHDNFTLWSYYANGMKGICIEYDTEMLLHSLTKDFSAQWLYTFDVSYLTPEYGHYGQIPIVNEKNLLSTEYEVLGPELIKVFATKPSLFTDENEFRLVLRPKPRISEQEHMQGLHKYKRQAITSVIFGHKTKRADRELVQKILGTTICYRTASVHESNFSVVVD